MGPIQASAEFSQRSPQRDLDEAFSFTCASAVQGRRKTMPLGELVYMPEESTPTIATEGNREAVAYLELGDHTDHYGRLFVAAPDLFRDHERIVQISCIDADDGKLALEALAEIRAVARAAIDKASGGAS
jgi:hypothetical protein